MNKNEYFQMQLARSNSGALRSEIEAILRKAATDLDTIEWVDDLSLQYNGIDAILTLKNGTRAALEIKCDYTDYENIVFEREQTAGKTLGWSLKRQESKLLMYYFTARKQAYFFGTSDVLAWYKANAHYLRDEKGYVFKTAKTTGSVIQPIPAEVVCAGVKQYAVYPRVVK